MKRAIATVHNGLAWVVLIAVGMQFFLAGLGLFGAATLQPHRMVGSLLIPVTLVLFLLALAGRLGSAVIGMSAALFVLTVVQSMLPRGPALIAAFHPVNALILLFIARALALRGRAQSTRVAPATP